MYTWYYYEMLGLFQFIYLRNRKKIKELPSQLTTTPQKTADRYCVFTWLYVLLSGCLPLYLKVHIDDNRCTSNSEPDAVNFEILDKFYFRSFFRGFIL